MSTLSSSGHVYNGSDIFAYSGELSPNDPFSLFDSAVESHWLACNRRELAADDDLRNQSAEAEKLVVAAVPAHKLFTIEQVKHVTSVGGVREFSTRYNAIIMLPTSHCLIGSGLSPLAATKSALGKLPPGLIVDLAA